MFEAELCVESLPGKGKGVITARRGSLPAHSFLLHVTHTQSQSLFKTVLDQLFAMDRNLVMSLDMRLGRTDTGESIQDQYFCLSA